MNNSKSHPCDLAVQQQAMLQSSAVAQAHLCLQHTAHPASLQAENQALLDKAAHELRQATATDNQREEVLQEEVTLQKEPSKIYLSNLSCACKQDQALHREQKFKQQQQAQTGREV